MGLLNRWQADPSQAAKRSFTTQLRVIELEARDLPAGTAALAAGVLTVVGGAEDNHFRVDFDASTAQLVVSDNGALIGRFNSDDVASISFNTGDGRNRVEVAPAVFQPIMVIGGGAKDTVISGGGEAMISGGGGDDKLRGGAGSNTLLGDAGNDLLRGGNAGPNMFNGDGGNNRLIKVLAGDSATFNAGDIILSDPGNAGIPGAPGAPVQTLMASEVEQLLRRASAASPSQDAIIAIVDRNGRILGVAVENQVSSTITSNPQMLSFAIDGAVALARTGAFFASNQAPLTSRTIRDLSQTTFTQREIEAFPFDTDPNSTLRGPGFVGDIGLGARFPINVANNAEVDLFAIEHTNRDSTMHPGPDRIKGTADDIQLNTRILQGTVNGQPANFTERSLRFDVDPSFVLPGQELFAPESYGLVSGIAPGQQARGLGTLAGGLPVYKNNQLVGGIGVFFPGKNGFANESNSVKSVTHNPALPDRTFEAEYIAFAAVGGVPTLSLGVGALGGEPAMPGFAIPIPPGVPARIDLVGLDLSIFGPEPSNEGAVMLANFAGQIGVGTAAFTAMPVTTTGINFIDGRAAAEGYLVAPHGSADGLLTAEEVNKQIMQAINQANITRAAIRLPLSVATRMVITVCDRNGEILGLFRMPDATIFSIDVSSAKSRNVAYYANPDQLQPGDQLAGVPTGVAFTNRTFRFLALPNFPSSANFRPGPFSILNDGGASIFNATQVGPRLPASVYATGNVLSRDAFNPGTNFYRGGDNPDPSVIRKQSGIVFFPGSVPLYKVINGQTVLVGGFGVSGDGVDQDDVVTAAGAVGLDQGRFLRADDVFVDNVRLPYQKTNRNALGLI
jgi:uncharacterized protein GlcG (DUF336 family)